MHRAVVHHLAALAALCLLGCFSPVRADIDMALNTSSFVPGQASVLSIDGTVTEDKKPKGGDVESSLCLFDDTLYYGGTEQNAVAIRTDKTLEWAFDYDYERALAPIYATPAICPEYDRVLFGDTAGHLFGVDVAATSPYAPTLDWSPPLSITGSGEAIYSSAPISPPPSSSGVGHAFVGGDDRHVHVLDAGQGTPNPTIGDPGTNDGAYLGEVRTSLAALDERLYVLVPGHYGTSGMPSWPAKLYCYRKP